MTSTTGSPPMDPQDERLARFAREVLDRPPPDVPLASVLAKGQARRRRRAHLARTGLAIVTTLAIVVAGVVIQAQRRPPAVVLATPHTEPTAAASGGPPPPSPEQPVPTYDSPMVMLADVSGMLSVLVDGDLACTYLGARPVAWPKGTTVQSDPPAVLARDGSVLARDGDTVGGSGGLIGEPHVGLSVTDVMGGDGFVDPSNGSCGDQGDYVALQDSIVVNHPTAPSPSPSPASVLPEGISGAWRLEAFDGADVPEAVGMPRLVLTDAASYVDLGCNQAIMRPTTTTDGPIRFEVLIDPRSSECGGEAGQLEAAYRQLLAEPLATARDGLRLTMTGSQGHVAHYLRWPSVGMPEGDLTFPEDFRLALIHPNSTPLGYVLDTTESTRQHFIFHHEALDLRVDFIYQPPVDNLLALEQEGGARLITVNGHQVAMYDHMPMFTQLVVGRPNHDDYVRIHLYQQASQPPPTGREGERYPPPNDLVADLITWATSDR